MCIQVIERYSICKCLYYKHAVDPCPSTRQRGHVLREKTVLVGYACETHSRSRAIQAYLHNLPVQPDSGYSSAASSLYQRPFSIDFDS